LSLKHPKITFISVNAEEYEELSSSFEIEMVPTVIFLKDGKMAEKVEGSDAAKVSMLAEKYSTFKPVVNNIVVPDRQRIFGLINAQPVMLFMKGTPIEPKCGFSRQAVELLKNVNCAYGSFDILTDEGIRVELKKISEWPTYPQIYVKGELIGGLDILKEMISTGEFQKIMPQNVDLNTRLKALINSAKLMLFMKGSPEQPKCGFSRVLVGILKDLNCDFKTFDILEDDQVRQGLKVYSDWPTYPQLYFKGELVGGLDIVKEMVSSGQFQEMILS
jgi:Grx4 family monothiol glutaredoxin